MFDENNKEIEKNNNLQEKIKDIRKNAFEYSLHDLCCGSIRKLCSKNVDFIERQKLFEHSSSLIDFYTDQIFFFKKMFEIEIIKFFLFSKEERKLVSILSNPDLIELDPKFFSRKIEAEYQENKIFNQNLDELFTKLLKEGRNNSSSNKLFELVREGNFKLFYSEDI